MMPVSEVLHQQGYSLDYALNHQDLIPFVKKYLFKKNRFTIAFLILNLLFVAAWLFLSIYYGFGKTLSVGHIVSCSTFGIVIAILLAPLHELLHGAAYRLCGAPVVSYKANWKKLYFMAIADQFITGRKAFYFIGAIPFVVISLGMLLLAVFAEPWQQVMWLTVLWVHASMCAGDFGLMSYFAEHGHRNVITYDDADNSISYFYSRDL